MRTWSTPDFRTLPDSPDGRFRWAGTRLLDEEQYRVERWERSDDGLYWRIDPAGVKEYNVLRDMRRADRKEAWREREAHDQAYTDWVNSLDGVQP